MKTVNFTMRESALFRVVHADGAYGGPTPTVCLYVAIYSQLPSIPTAIVQEITDNGLGSEIEKTANPAIDRRLEVGLVMDMHTAVGLRDWLDQQVAKLKKIAEEKTEKTGQAEKADQ